MTAWSARGGPPPLLHGFGGIVEPVAWWADPDLVASEERARSAAGALGSAKALLLRGNGGLAVGTSLERALVAAWCLEDRCAVALHADQTGRPFDDDEVRRRSRWYGPETDRLWGWLAERYGEQDHRGRHGGSDVHI